ncbi:MAG TPA: proline--tRNA ligase [Solirubrobacteraceae bacterium]|nr:proline--tRNA ligase [Solirubrobacteraceae bacterium]
MRLSELLLPTERQAPADAEALSHILMVRAGLIRQMGAGLWSWLPAGWRVHQRVVAVLREEMEAAGAQEVLMPVLQPADPWRRTGRYDSVGPELFRLEDRRRADLVLAMTHEEAMTFHVAQTVRSYRELPFSLFQVQVKERDEPRPRAGVLRTREFVMKDAYSFDRDREGLERSYGVQREAYDRIFDRCGLRWYRVESDVGMMGGFGAHEYMAPCPAGEDEVALAPGYAANVEVASAQARPVDLPPPLGAPEPVETLGHTTVDEVARALGVPAGALLKAYPVISEGRGLVMVCLRGDHRVNDTKLAGVLGGPFRPAEEGEIAERIGPPGYIGPVGADVSVLLDDAVAEGEGYVCGANEPNRHLRGVSPGRDFPFRRGDVRRVEAGDTVAGHAITIEPCIEIGQIFKLGTRYSEPLGASYLDEQGREQPIWMGSYGIGPARIAAAAVEQHADEQGIAWPRAIAPYDVEIVPLGKAGGAEREAAERLYEELRGGGLAVLLDDRDAGPGEKFADAELLGCPLRLTIGRRSLECGTAEAQARRGRADLASVPLEDAREAVRARWDELP